MLYIIMRTYMYLHKLVMYLSKYLIFRSCRQTDVFNAQELQDSARVSLSNADKQGVC